MKKSLGSCRIALKEGRQHLANTHVLWTRTIKLKEQCKTLEEHQTVDAHLQVLEKTRDIVALSCEILVKEHPALLHEWEEDLDRV